MKEPFLYEEDAPIVWSPKQVVRFVRLLEKLELTDEFVLKGQEFDIPVSKDFVNFAKKFLFEHKAHDKSEEARELITSATCPKRPNGPY